MSDRYYYEESAMTKGLFYIRDKENLDLFVAETGVETHAQRIVDALNGVTISRDEAIKYLEAFKKADQAALIGLQKYIGTAADRMYLELERAIGVENEFSL